MFVRPLKPVPVARFARQATGMPVDPLRSSEAFESFDTEQSADIKSSTYRGPILSGGAVPLHRTGGHQKPAPAA
jgi:hypothetical protein